MPQRTVYLNHSLPNGGTSITLPVLPKPLLDVSPRIIQSLVLRLPRGSPSTTPHPSWQEGAACWRSPPVPALTPWGPATAPMEPENQPGQTLCS